MFTLGLDFQTYEELTSLEYEELTLLSPTDFLQKLFSNKLMSLPLGSYSFYKP